jgi:hypothetical protein
MPDALSRSVRRFAAIALALSTLGWGGATAQAPAGGEVTQLATALIDSAFPSGAPEQKDGRLLFRAVLDSEAFRHGTAAGFTIYAIASDPAAATGLIAAAQKGLEPLGTIEGLVTSGGDGSGSAPTQSIVLAQSKADFERVLALLDHCEELGFSKWKPDNLLWTPENRDAEVARTWEVQVFNLQHPAISERSEQWFEHGIGYYTLAHLVNRAVRQGAWGLSPPWFDQGLIDELDIQAYGTAWVGAEGWVVETEGWFRPGWSGFLPTGVAPPPAPSGPPKDLATTVKKTGDPWADRERSADRHWAELVDDRRSAAPASFAYMAEHQSFLPRDRAYARCALHMLLALDESAGGPTFWARLQDRKAVAPDGMPPSDPLTVIVADALGGVPDVARFEALPLSDVLAETKQDALAARLTELEADGLLALTDHREQSRWLYEQWKGQMAYRGEMFRLIMEAEQAQQLHEWGLIGKYLDRGMAGLLAACPKFPTTDAERAAALQAFRAGFTQEVMPLPPATTEEPVKKAPVKKKAGQSSKDKSAPKR